MSRKSAVSLAIVPMVGQMLPPADGLTPAQAEIWKSVVATKPADWFGADSAPVLAEYCRAITLANDIAARVDSFDPTRLETYEGFKLWKGLTDMQRQQSKLVATLAVKMRLTQQSRYDTQKSATAHRRAGLDRPWVGEQKETQTG